MKKIIAILTIATLSLTGCGANTNNVETFETLVIERMNEATPNLIPNIEEIISTVGAETEASEAYDAFLVYQQAKLDLQGTALNAAQYKSLKTDLEDSSFASAVLQVGVVKSALEVSTEEEITEISTSVKVFFNILTAAYGVDTQVLTDEDFKADYKKASSDEVQAIFDEYEKQYFIEGLSSLEDTIDYDLIKEQFGIDLSEFTIDDLENLQF